MSTSTSHRVLDDDEKMTLRISEGHVIQVTDFSPWRRETYRDIFLNFNEDKREHP